MTRECHVQFCKRLRVKLPRPTYRRLHLFKFRRPLSRKEAQLESPPWHEEALRETVARHDAGKEQPIDWGAAKRELRNRAE
jgi:hypothetical protein